MITHNSRSSSIRVRPQQVLSYLFSIQRPHRTSLTRSSDDSREQWRPVVSCALGWRRAPQTGDGPLHNSFPLDSQTSAKSQRSCYVCISTAGVVRPDNIPLELGLIVGFALLCGFLFLLYLRLAPRPNSVPAEFFMQTRLPLIRCCCSLKSIARFM